MKILILHDKPEDFRDWIERACPGDQFQWATTALEVTEFCQSFEPEIIFSIKHSEFPGEQHFPALNFPSVKWFQVGGSGTEHLSHWDPKRTVVSNSVGVLAPFHAERAMAALLSLSTGLLELREQQSQKIWKPTRFSTLMGRTMLILGLGCTGAELAVRAKAFGMKVIAVKRSPAEHPSVDEMHLFQDLGKLWGRADVLSVNLRHRDETHQLLNDAIFAQLPSGCLFLNGARGAVVDQEALERALISGKLGGAWLDVTTPEPLPAESVLWDLPNVILQPHCADQVEDFPLRFARFFVQNLERYRQGLGLLNEVGLV